MIMKKITFAFVLSILSIQVFSQEKNIEAEANITNITMYTTSAEINYEKQIHLKAGKNTVVFTGLSLYIEDNTINVSVSSSEVNIITVTNHINYLKQKKSEGTLINQLNDSIKMIERESGLLNCKIETFENEKNLLMKGQDLGGISKGVPVSEMEKAATFFRTRYLELTTTMFEMDKTIAKNNEKIKNYKNQIAELSSTTSVTSSELNIVVESPTEQNVGFTFKYLTPKAGWAPFYDIKYNGPEKPIDFIFRANVFNASGVNWKDVKIKLSTADPISGFNTPSFSSNKSNSQGNKMNVKTEKYDDQTISYNQVEVSDVFAEYPVKHKYTIVSDAKPYLVEVASYSMPSLFSYLTIPKLSPFGFLMAKIPVWHNYNLISGTTNIYNKGTYMGKTFLNTWAENDTLQIYLGNDNNIFVSREEKNQNNPRSFIGNYVTDETNIAITIKNNYPQPVNIEILDQVPVSDDNDKVKLDVFNIETANYNKEEGLIRWNLTMKGNESSSLNFKYILKAPKDYGDAFRMKKAKFRAISCPAF